MNTDVATLRRRIEEAEDAATITDVDASIGRTAISGEHASPFAAAPLDPSKLPRLTLARDGAVDLVEVSTLGAGGMGRVLLALQTSLGRHVAVKTINADATSHDRAALLREAFLTGALEHPAIVPVHAFGVDPDGRPLLVMKRVEGVSWAMLLAAPNHDAWTTHLGAPAERLDAHLEIMSAVCRALELAHARGIVHRDIKPENVMVGAFGEVYLVDWGIAVAAGLIVGEPIVGTPSYMAPEMVYGTEVDARTDVYLLGATLHRVLTGRARHSAQTLGEAMANAAESQPASYDAKVPAALGELANRACALVPGARPASARAFREEIARWKRDRGAIKLGAAARERLDRLRALLETAGDRPPTDLVLAYRLATEARFGFMQAMEQAPDVEDAAAGETLAIEAHVELALRQDQVDTAAALLAESREPSPALLARIEAARRRTELDAKERERLREVDRALDPSFGRWARAVPLFVVGIAGAVIGVLLRTRTLGSSPLNSLLMICATIGIIGAVSIAMRRKIFGHLYNRRVWSLLALALAVMLVNRGTVLALGYDVTREYANDMLTAATVLATGAILVTPRMLVATAIMTVAWVVAMARPEASVTLFYAGIVLATIAGTWATATSRRVSTAVL